ncbi:MAG TPA: DUF58 domain-containing protein [Spirochaetia bacterium]|nr:DUF58 domain-containing protein [Spirochaetia bacterium]
MNGAEFFKRVKRIELVSTKIVQNLLAGNYRSVFRGTGIEFDEVREYVSGDDVRRIDWNVTSRMSNAYTKTYREERELSLFLIADVSSSLFYSSGDVAKDRVSLMVFAILAISAVMNNDRVGGVFFSNRIERWINPGKGKKHVLRLINDLMSSSKEGKGSDLALAVRTVSESLKRRGICVLISDFKTTGYWDELTHLSRKHDVIAVKIFDPVDYEFPPVGVVELEDPETGQVILGEGYSRRFRQSYEKFWDRHNLEWQNQCARRGVETLSLNTSEDPTVKLVQFFQRRRRRR